MKQEANKKGMGVVIALAVAILAGVIVLTIAIVGVIKDNGSSDKDEDTTLYTLAGVKNTTEKSSGYFDWEDEDANSEEDASVSFESNQGGINVEAGDSVTVTTTKKTDTYNPVEEYEKLSKEGENILDDYHKNKYIKLVSQNYGVDTENLVAIYSEPDRGENFVLQFNGTKDSDGNVIKSPDTLEKVYLIDENKNISIATGKTTGNVGVSYAEGTLCFNMIKTIVMPQYPDYFTGVDD